MKKYLGGWFRMLAKPIVRPAADVTQSVQGIARSWERVKEIKQQREEDAKHVAKYLDGMSPEEKFEEIYSINQWTEVELAKQARAARNTRLGFLAMVAMLLPGLVWIVISGPIWVMLISMALSILFFAACVAQAVRFAWWEAQIQERSCFPMKDMLGREDLFQRLFRL